jgi:alpha-L-arabinofuranosidase
LERNGDVVAMASYAPLFVHPAWKAWNPNAIVFDSARAYGTPSYHVQAMFAANRADRTLPTLVEAKDSPRGGMIGVGTWKTQAEFRDIKVTHDGKSLFASDFSRGLIDWSIVAGGWSVRDGVLRQMSDGEGARVLAGNKEWTDYTLTLKARKTGGAEGFLVLFANQSVFMHEKYWWNIGGWGNTRHALEGAGLSDDSVAGNIETGRWYAIKVELQGAKIACYLDNKLIHTATRKAVPRLFATAGLVNAGSSAASDELILKVVNGSLKPTEVAISLQGLKRVNTNAQAIVLTGTDPGVENAFENPAHVSPQIETIERIAPEFRHTFPACSVTILRIK